MFASVSLHLVLVISQLGNSSLFFVSPLLSIYLKKKETFLSEISPLKSTFFDPSVKKS